MKKKQAREMDKVLKVIRDNSSEDGNHNISFSKISELTKLPYKDVTLYCSRLKSDELVQSAFSDNLYYTGKAVGYSYQEIRGKEMRNTNLMYIGFAVTIVAAIITSKVFFFPDENKASENGSISALPQDSVVKQHKEQEPPSTGNIKTSSRSNKIIPDNNNKNPLDTIKAEKPGEPNESNSTDVNNINAPNNGIINFSPNKGQQTVNN